jgi:secreted trypsin-like serine protease
MSRLPLPAALVTLLLLLPASSAQAIVGGVPASQTYSHMAAMYYDPPESDGAEDTGYRFRCGASLIRNDWILTAAHCVRSDVDDDGEEDTLDPARVRYLVGTQRRSEGGETLQAEKIIVHESYHDPFYFSHDIAVVHLKNSTTLGTPIRVGTPAERTPYWEPGVTARVIGWGADNSTVGSVQDDLREVDMPIVDDTDCHVSYPSEFLIGEFEPLTMICAGETHGTKDSCQGDSGGPLMTKDATGAFMQVGIVSWGAFCALPTQYGVYSRAAGQTLRTWMDEQIAANSAAPAPPPSEPLPQPSATAPPVLPAAASSASAPPRDVEAILFRKVRRNRRMEIGCRLRGATLRGCQVEVLVKRRGRLRTFRTLTLRAGQTKVIRTGRVRRLVLRGVLLADDGSRYRVRRTIRRTT